MSSRRQSRLANDFPSSEVTILDEQLPALRHILAGLEGGPNAAVLKLAISRWDSSTTERVREEDKLVDYWIALESLFCPDSAQELKFRASLRIAAFLGQTGEDRCEIYDAMRRSYDRRSELVHGRTVDNIAQVAETTRRYLREALLRILEMEQPFRPEGIEVTLLGTN